MRAVLVVLLAALAIAPATAAAASYVNPVVDGDLPDPTVLRDGDGFWAVTTSKDWLPAFPLLFSRDLVHWERVGAVLDDPPAWARRAFWAPEIARWGGVVRVYFAAARFGGPPCIGVATARTPAGPYRSRGIVHCPTRGAIDPYPVTDEAGQRWLVYKGFGARRGIWLRRLTEDGLRTFGPATWLLEPAEPWEEATTEGANLVRHDGRWYLLYSGGHCCSPPCTYAVGVARADAITGPYVRAVAPSLISSEALKCPGHGTLVGDGRGGDWYLHHGYPVADERNVRRRILLTPVSWSPDGWPVFGADGTVPVAGPGPPEDAAALPGGGAGFTEDFAGSRLGPAWEWPVRAKPHVAVGGGELRLRAPAAPDRRRLVARQVAAASFTARAVVRPGSCNAGLAVVGFDDVATGIEVTDSRLRVWRGRRTARMIAGTPRGAGGGAVAEEAIELTATVTDGRTVTFAAGGRPVGPPVPTGQRGDALRVALTCTGPRGAQATFGQLRVVA